jgi:putative ABC transport system permease protein
MKGDKKKVSFDTFCADPDFFDILGIEIVSGKLYSANLASDKKKLIVNEAFLREYNIKDPVGVSVTMGMPDEQGFSSEIIGVVKDFHYKPVNLPVAPLAIRNETNASYCMVNIQTNQFKSIKETIANIRKTASELSPSFPVEVTFLDQAVQNMYQAEIRFRRTFSLLAGSAVFICCLGILAMSIFACQRRVKEIGIRKVNGARISEVLAMLNMDFGKWVGIAFIIACPVAWYVMHKWLQSFAYKTEISLWLFGLAGIMVLGIALLTVSWQSWRAATRNPVESLRYE